MRKKVQLTLTGRQRGEDGTETITQTRAEADYFEKEGCLYLLYEETSDETGTVSKNVIKWKDSVLDLTKRGAVNTHMVFQAGTEYRAEYATPYGCLQMDVRTEAVEAFFCGDKLTQIRAKYALCSESCPFAESELTIAVDF